MEKPLCLLSLFLLGNIISAVLVMFIAYSIASAMLAVILLYELNMALDVSDGVGKFQFDQFQHIESIVL